MSTAAPVSSSATRAGLVGGVIEVIVIAWPFTILQRTRPWVAVRFAVSASISLVAVTFPPVALRDMLWPRSFATVMSPARVVRVVLPSILSEVWVMEPAERWAERCSLEGTENLR